MITEYVVLGSLLIVMGIVQIWLRHGPGVRKTEGTEGVGGGEESGPSGWRREEMPRPFSGSPHRGRGWQIWTAILGFVGVGFGVVLVVLGVLG
jgi:hypothetical protein